MIKPRIQIDVVAIRNQVVSCYLYTNSRFVKIMMYQEDYDALKRDGFFLRQGDDEVDAVGIINTTDIYEVDIVAKYYLFARGHDCDGVGVPFEESMNGPYTKIYAERYCEELNEASEGVYYRVVDEYELRELTGGRWPLIKSGSDNLPF